MNLRGEATKRLRKLSVVLIGRFRRRRAVGDLRFTQRNKTKEESASGDKEKVKKVVWDILGRLDKNRLAESNELEAKQKELTMEGHAAGGGFDDASGASDYRFEELNMHDVRHSRSFVDKHVGDGIDT